MLVLSSETSLRDLIGQFEDFEMSEEPMVRLLRFHQHLSQVENHRPWLMNALEDSINSSLDEKLIAAQYLAFLEAFYPDHQLEDLNLLRHKMMQGLMYNMQESQAARKFIGMLSIEQELVKYMAQARTFIKEITRISDLSPICAFLDILVKHMEWKAKRKVLVRQKKTDQNQFLHNVIDFCTGEYGQREEILSGMVRLAAATMNYLKEINYFSQDDSNPINRNKLIRMRQALLGLTIYKQEVSLDICKAITLSLHLLALQSEKGEDKLYAKVYYFLNNNENCINECDYLELLMTFLKNLEEVKESNRSEITKILSKLLKAIIVRSQTSTKISYRSKAMMIDIIIKITSLFTCQPSKEIIKLVRPDHSQNQLAFIGALLVIFDPKMSNEYLNSVPQNRRNYIFITKQHVLYKETLRRYCDPNFDFSQSITNPEIREQLMWDLLLLRITIETNYNALIQLKSIHILIINLVKMILLDCLPDQCYQIIQKIIQRENFYTIRELDVIPLIKIIQDVTPILSNQVRGMENPIQKFNTMYRNLFKVLILLSKNHNLRQTKQPTLFIKVIRINNILNDYAVTPQLIKSQKQLLSACIVPYFDNINKGQLVQAVNELIDQIQKHKSVQTFLIFLEVMSRSRRYPDLHSIYTELNAAIENVIKQVRMPPTVMQSYRILSFLLSKPNITFEVVKDAWDLVRNIDSYHYIDQFHSVLQLHKYSDNYIRTKHNQANQINYLVYQMEQILSLLNYIDDTFDNTAFLVRCEELTRYKLAVLDYSLIVVTRYTNANGAVCNQTAKLDRYLHIALTRIRETPQLATIFSIRPGFRLKWINCQFSILLLIGHLRRPKLCFSERPIRELMKDLDQKRELLRKIYPQEYKATFQYYSRLLTCKLIELREVLREEQRRRE